MPNYNIVTDSCCDLRPETYEQLNLTVVPLSMEFRGQVREDKSDDSIKEVYAALRAGESAQTAAVNPDRWLNAMEPHLAEGRDVLVMAFSSGLSTTYQSAVIAAEELREKWQTLQQGRAGGGWGTSLEEVLQNAVTTLSRRVVGWLGGIASSLPSILFTMTFTVLSTIFFLQDYAGITGFIVRSLPGRWLRPMVESKRYLLGAVQKVLFAYLCIMFITFGEITLGLWLLRVPYFAAIAFAIALLDILPFIGSGLFLIPWGAYHLLISRQTALGAGLLLLYAVVTVVRMWLEPRIVGGRIGLHPLATLTAMYAGLKIFGFWGLLLAPLGTTLLLHLRQGGYLRGEG